MNHYVKRLKSNATSDRQQKNIKWEKGTCRFALAFSKHVPSRDEFSVTSVHRLKISGILLSVYPSWLSAVHEEFEGQQMDGEKPQPSRSRPLCRFGVIKCSACRLVVVCRVGTLLAGSGARGSIAGVTGTDQSWGVNDGRDTFQSAHWAFFPGD